MTEHVVVVGVDGSEESLEAMRWAAGQCALTGARLRVIRVWQWPTAWGWSGYQDSEIDLEGGARDDLAATVSAVLGPTPEVAVEQLVIEGAPAPVLIEQAAGADLLVLGARGLGAFASMLVGSVSQHCMQHAACPVVVVRHHGAAAA